MHLALPSVTSFGVTLPRGPLTPATYTCGPCMPAAQAFPPWTGPLMGRPTVGMLRPRTCGAWRGMDVDRWPVCRARCRSACPGPWTVAPVPGPFLRFCYAIATARASTPRRHAVLRPVQGAPVTWPWLHRWLHRHPADLASMRPRVLSHCAGCLCRLCAGDWGGVMQLSKKRVRIGAMRPRGHKTPRPKLCRFLCRFGGQNRSKSGKTSAPGQRCPLSVNTA